MRAEDVARYLEAVRGDPYKALYVVAILGGPRPAELLTLRWDDFDEATGTLRIDESVSHLAGGELDWNESKSEMGRRVVPLTAEARRVLADRAGAPSKRAWRPVSAGTSGARSSFPPRRPEAPLRTPRAAAPLVLAPGQGRPRARASLRPEAHRLDAAGQERGGPEDDPGDHGAR